MCNLFPQRGYTCTCTCIFIFWNRPLLIKVPLIFNLFFYLLIVEYDVSNVCIICLAMQPVAACAMPVMAGWRIKTDSEMTRKARYSGICIPYLI